MRLETAEIATTRNGRDVTRGYVDALPFLPSTDDVFNQYGGWTAWKELLRDDQVAATFRQRCLAVTSRPTEVEPASERRVDRKAADLVRETIDRLDWDAITEQMLYARLFGYSVAEVIWAFDKSRQIYVVDDIRVRDPERFVFAPDGSLRLLTTQNPAGEPLPERKFWVLRLGAFHHDEPYGRGLAHQLYWPVWFKRNGARFWATYLEKFGAPTVVGTAPAGSSSAEIANLLEAAAAVQTDSAIVLPEGTQMQLLEASRAGEAGYEAWLSYWDRAIAKIVLGQTMTTEDGSSRAQAEVHAGVKREVVQSDAAMICESAVSSWISWLTKVSVAGAAPPLIWRDLSEPEDLAVRAQRDATLASIGWRLRADAVVRVYGDDYEPAEQAEQSRQGRVPPEADGEQVSVSAAEVSAAEPAALPAELPPPPADQIADRLAVEASPEVDKWLETLRRMVEQAGSLAELRGMILDAFGSLPADELAAVLGQAMLVADAAGRSDVLDEAADA